MKYRIKAALILLRAFLAYARRGKAVRHFRVRKVLVAQRGQLGDMVCTTPVFCAIRARFPEVEIIVVGKQNNRPLLEGHPCVDKYLVLGANFSRRVDLLRKEDIDYACITNPDFETLAALFIAGVDHIVAPVVVGGRSPQETITYRMLRTLVDTREHHFGSYAPREYLRLIEPLGAKSEDTTKTLVVDEASRGEVEKFLVGHGGQLCVGISPAAGNKVKEWQIERFVEVAQYLYDTHSSIVYLTGTKDDMVKTRAIESALGEPTWCVNIAGKLNLKELIALIAALDLFVAVDTGPIYIAEALGVSTVDLVGPMDENEQPPTGPGHELVIPERNESQLHIMNARKYDEEEARRQVEAMSVKMVKVAIDKAVNYIIANKTHGLPRL